MEDETIGRFLDELASDAPAPGGGAAAALDAAMAAALVEMVCSLTVGKPAYAEHEALMSATRARAAELRADSLALAAEDAAAFSAVIDAYRLPRASEQERELRRSEVQRALAGAADVPRRTALAAAELVALAEAIVAGANPNVVSDAAAAAASARAALQTARVNIEINRASIDDAELNAALALSVRAIEAELPRADAVVAAVLERLGR
jgi:methenyltetrahydrofolate cyclohydrolase